LAKILKDIESSSIGTDSEKDIKGLFDDYDVNSNKLGATVLERNDRLTKLIEAIGKLNFGDYKDNTIDLFGDAYEFLMGMYASKAGKSGGGVLHATRSVRIAYKNYSRW
jgi:type I restriction enzyme M protein